MERLIDRGRIMDTYEPVGVSIILAAVAINSLEPERWPSNAAVTLLGFLIIALTSFLSREQKLPVSL